MKNIQKLMFAVAGMSASFACFATGGYEYVEVAEPGSFALLGIGVAGLLATSIVKRRRK